MSNILYFRNIFLWTSNIVIVIHERTSKILVYRVNSLRNFNLPCSGVLGCLSAAAVELSPVAPPVAVAVAVVVIDEAVVVSTARAQTRRTCMGSSFRIDTTSAWYRPSSFLPFTYKQIKIFESGFFSSTNWQSIVAYTDWIKCFNLFGSCVFFQIKCR